MSFFVFPVLILVAALPIAWLVSELKSDKRSVRCTLGIFAILSCFGVAWLTSQLLRLNYNVWYGAAARSLINASVERLDAGDSQTVLRELKGLQQTFRPTYENKAHFDKLAAQTAKKIAKKTLPSNVAFDWVMVDGKFYLEVKNGTAQEFKLDVFFMPGYNLDIIGMDANFKQIYKIENQHVDLKRVRPTIVSLLPGRSYRTRFQVESLLESFPADVKYITLKWTSNDMGTELPGKWLKTTIYELRKSESGKGVESTKDKRQVTDPAAEVQWRI